MKKIIPIVALFLLMFIATPLFAQNEQANAAAQQYLSQGKFREALAVLDKDIADGKVLFASYRLRGTVKSMMGDFPGAVADVSEAIKLKPDDGSLYEDRARFKMFSGTPYADIIPDLDMAIATGHRTLEVFSRRGELRLFIGDTKGAIEDYQLAVGFAPDLALPTLGLASAYRGNREPDRAIAVLEEFLRSLESSPVKKQNIGTIVVRGDVQNLEHPANKKAVTSVQTVIIKDNKKFDGMPSKEEMEKRTRDLEQQQNIPAIYTSLADLYIQKKNDQQALEVLTKAFAADWVISRTYELRGSIKGRAGDLPGAMKDIDQAIELRPKLPTPYLERGIIYLLMRDSENSQKDFDKYLELFPRGKPYLEKRIEEANKKLSETSVGVVECDDYIRKMRSCLFAHTPIASFTTLNASIDSMAQAWKSAVSTPESKAALAAACSQARQTARASLSGYDCEW